MTPERISRSTRTAHGLDGCNFPPQAILLPSQRSAACIIAMSVEPREIGEAARSACPHQPNCPQFIFEQGQEANCDHQSQSCSDSLAAVTPADGVFGSDRYVLFLTRTAVDPRVPGRRML